MSLSIQMVDLNINPNFTIPKGGKYLVKTISETDNSVHGKYTHTQFLQVRANLHFDTKKDKWVNHFDCTNQKVIMVSSEPLEL